VLPHGAGHGAGAPGGAEFGLALAGELGGDRVVHGWLLGRFGVCRSGARADRS
jgi:hypothetical protein